MKTTHRIYKVLTLAFGNKIALTVDYVNIEATCASALPHSLTKLVGAPFERADALDV